MIQCASCILSELQLGSRRDRWLDVCRQAFFVWNACEKGFNSFALPLIFLSYLSYMADISVYTSKRTLDNFISFYFNMDPFDRSPALKPACTCLCVASGMMLCIGCSLDSRLQILRPSFVGYIPLWYQDPVQYHMSYCIVL